MKNLMFKFDIPIALKIEKNEMLTTFEHNC